LLLLCYCDGAIAPTAAVKPLEALYYCFTTALLLLYYCFTTAAVTPLEARVGHSNVLALLYLTINRDAQFTCFTITKVHILTRRKAQDASVCFWETPLPLDVEPRLLILPSNGSEGAALAGAHFTCVTRTKLANTDPFTCFTRVVGAKRKESALSVWGV
jgi:hypothetical protein